MAPKLTRAIFVMPVRTVVAIWPLFAGLSLIGLAVGVQGSLLGVRAALEGFDDLLIGLLMSCYFAGFLAGSLLTPRDDSTRWPHSNFCSFVSSSISDYI